MRILFMTPRFPYPPHKGDQTLAYHRIRTLSTRHEIVLLTFFERDAELEGLDHLSQCCRAIHTVRLPRWRSYWNMLHLGIFSRAPLQILYYHSAEYQRKLNDLLHREPFDVVHAFMLRLAPYLRGVAAPKVLELIDSMQLSMRRIAERSSGLARLVYSEELRRIRSYERAADHFADRLVFVSEIDRAMVSSDRSVSLPLGVISGESPSTQRSGHVVVFSGNMAYPPNVQAASWFVSKAWGTIREAVPDAELWVAGRNPTAAIRSVASRPGIRVTGFVPDMRQILLQAQVAIAPMQSGSGMQNKVLEAMACGLPVVATTLGLGAIGARPGEELLVADEPGEFAAAVTGLLLNHDRRASIGSKGWEYVRAHHSWEHIADQIDSLYHAIVGTETAASVGARRSA